MGNCYCVNSNSIKSKSSVKSDIDVENDLNNLSNVRKNNNNNRRSTVFVSNKQKEKTDKNLESENIIIDKQKNYSSFRNGNYLLESNDNERHAENSKKSDIKKDLNLTEVLSKQNLDYLEKKKGKKTINVTLMGDKLVGKTSILYQFTEKKFSNHYVNTIYKEDKQISIKVKENEYYVYINSLSGDVAYQGNYTNIYENTDFFLIVFDVSNHDSFLKIRNILTEDIIEYLCLMKNDYPNVIILGNKIDLKTRNVTNEEINEFCKKYKFDYFEVSAKNNLYLEKAFYKLSEIYDEIFS